MQPLSDDMSTANPCQDARLGAAKNCLRCIFNRRMTLYSVQRNLYTTTPGEPGGALKLKLGESRSGEPQFGRTSSCFLP